MTMDEMDEMATIARVNVNSVNSVDDGAASSTPGLTSDAHYISSSTAAGAFFPSPSSTSSGTSSSSPSSSSIFHGATLEVIIICAIVASLFLLTFAALFLLRRYRDRQWVRLTLLQQYSSGGNNNTTCLIPTASTASAATSPPPPPPLLLLPTTPTTPTATWMLMDDAAASHFVRIMDERYAHAYAGGGASGSPLGLAMLPAARVRSAPITSSRTSSAHDDLHEPPAPLALAHHAVDEAAHAWIKPASRSTSDDSSVLVPGELIVAAVPASVVSIGVVSIDRFDPFPCALAGVAAHPAHPHLQSAGAAAGAIELQSLQPIVCSSRGGGP